MTNRATDEASRLRDKLAMKYMYTSSTQRSYEGVPWDTILPNKRWPPTSTLEDRPDMIDQRYTLKRYAPSAEEWQVSGKGWLSLEFIVGNIEIYLYLLRFLNTKMALVYVLIKILPCWRQGPIYIYYSVSWLPMA